MAVLNKKLSGSTLVEIIAAMLITMITFGIAMIICINSFRAAGFGTKFKARISLSNMELSTIENQQFFNTDSVVGDMKIERKIDTYGANKKINVLSLKAIDKEGRVIDQTQQLIITP